MFFSGRILFNYKNLCLVFIITSSWEILNKIILQIYLWDGARLLGHIYTTGLVIPVLHLEYSPTKHCFFFLFIWLLI